VADHLNTNGLVDGNIPAGHSCPFLADCLTRRAWCPSNDGMQALRDVPYSCAAARAHSMIANMKEVER
jgi:hypothetical protein